MTVHVGDGDHTGRDKKVHNDAEVIRYLIGAVIALAVAMVWIIYYVMGGNAAPPSPAMPADVPAAVSVAHDSK